MVSIRNKVASGVIYSPSPVSKIMIESMLAQTGLVEIIAATTGREAIVSAIADMKPRLVFIDVGSAPHDGLTIMADLHDFKVLRKVILYTDEISGQDRAALEAAGSCAFFGRNELLSNSERFCSALQDLISFEQLQAELLIDERPFGEQTQAPVGLDLLQPQAFLLPPPVRGPIRETREFNMVSGGGMWSEVNRLELLHGLNIANDADDFRLDIITRHLCTAAGYPMAAVTLIDESTQWIKSACGFRRGSVPRSGAICAHTIEHAAPMVVPDTLQHPVFSSFDCVRGELNIRAYIGVPILMDGKLPIGAVCLLDDMPRPSAHKEIALLTDMAELIAALFQPGRLASAA